MKPMITKKQLKKASELAECARVAYLDGKQAKDAYKELGYKNHKFFDIDGAQCHAVWDDQQYILAFRGTEPDQISDILADLNALPKKSMTDGWVHMGFRGEVDKLWKDIEAHQEKYCGERSFYICGHSLGAAMATIATSRFEDVEMAEVRGLFTYGSPRAGTSSFVKGINTPHFRFVNNNDIVTAVPPWFMMYRHSGQLVYINHYGNIRKMTVWQRIKDKWRGYKSGLTDGIGDHDMSKYCQFIRNNCDD